MKNMEEKAMIPAFLEETGMNPSSVYIYKTTLDLFFSEVEKEFCPPKLSREYIEWWNDRNIRTKKDSTASIRMCALRAFVGFLNKHGSAINIDGITAPRKRPRRSPREVIPIEKLKEILLVAKNKKSPRDYTMLCLLINYGLRANELVQLNIGDVNTDSSTPCITLLRKGHRTKDEKLLLTPAICDVLNEYLQYLRHAKKEQSAVDAPLFPSPLKNKGRLTTRTLECVINDYLVAVGLRESSDGCSPYTLHSLRHSAITYALANIGAYEVQQMASHKSLQGTAYYFHSPDNPERNDINTLASYALKRSCLLDYLIN